MRVTVKHAIAPAGLPGDRVEAQVGEGQRLAGVFGPAPQQGPQAGEQFGQGERLDQVVVGPGVEPLHPVLDGIPGGQHQDGRVVARRPHPTAHVEAVDDR